MARRCRQLLGWVGLLALTGCHRQPPPLPAPELKPSCPEIVAKETADDTSVDIDLQFAQRALIRNDLMMAAGSLNALLEHRYAMGRWPDQMMLRRLGFGEPQQWATTWLAGMEVSSEGTVTIVLNEAAGGGRLEFGVRGDVERAFAWWQCQSSDRSDAGWLLPGCTYVGDGAAQMPPVRLDLDHAKAEPHTARSLRRSIAEDVSRVAAHVQMVVGDFYRHVGIWPDLAQVGLTPAQRDWGRWISEIAMIDPPTLLIRLHDDAGGGVLQYQPQTNATTLVEWRCTSPDRSDIGRYLPGCRYRPAGAP